jgi:hypothetical protein
MVKARTEISTGFVSFDVARCADAKKLMQVNSSDRLSAYHWRMPRFSIHMINSEFESTDDVDYPSLESARKAAIASATSIVAESIGQGEPTSAVEVQIFENDQMVSRQVVTLSVSQFTTGE